MHLLRLALPYCEASPASVRCLRRLGALRCAAEARGWAAGQLRARAAALGLLQPAPPGVPAERGDPPAGEAEPLLLGAVFAGAHHPRDSGSVHTRLGKAWTWMRWPSRQRGSLWSDVACRYLGMGHYLMLAYSPEHRAYFFRHDGGSNGWECAEQRRFYREFRVEAGAVPLMGARAALDCLALERLPAGRVVGE